MSRITELRRALNDSRIGRMVNGTTAGVLVEGASRSISYSVRQAGYERLNSQAAAIGRDDPLKGAMLRQLVANYALQNELRVASPANAYSHTSPLYRPTVLDLNGAQIDYMAPVRVSDVLAAKREAKLMSTLARGMGAAQASYVRP